MTQPGGAMIQPGGAMTLREAIARLVEGGSLTRTEMRAAMHELMSGAASPAQIAGFLVALRMQG